MFLCLNCNIMLKFNDSSAAWMNSSSYIVHDIQTMSIQLSKQCPNCKRCFTKQKSFKHHIRHCRRTNCEETLNNLVISAANLLLSNFTPGVETNVFQQSNLTQSYEDEYRGSSR